MPLVPSRSSFLGLCVGDEHEFAAWPVGGLPDVEDAVAVAGQACPDLVAAAAAVRIGTVPPVDVTGSPAAVLAWLSGRGAGSGLDTGAAGLPSLPPLA